VRRTKVCRWRTFWSINQEVTSHTLHGMWRQFSMFAHGAPGAGLLLLRLAAGPVLVVQGTTTLFSSAAFADMVSHTLLILSGVLLLIGLWTSIAGALVALCAIWHAVSQSAFVVQCILIGIWGLALALLGPGAWSIDAWRYKWRRIEIPDRKQA
jgi:putative oxidoreductase